VHIRALENDVDAPHKCLPSSLQVLPLISHQRRLTTYAPYGLLLAYQPNVACMHAPGALSSACELRWTLKLVADVEAVVVCLRLATAAGLAPAVVPASTCNIAQ